MLYTTANPLAVQMYPEKAGVITSIIQTCLGLGLCMGPPLGSLLIPLGGYKTPFIVVSVIEFIVFILGCIFVPSKGAKAKSKIKGSDYVRFLVKPSTLSAVIPAAAIFCIVGVRDSACALYFENVLGLDNVTVGYVFIANSVAYFITCPLVGILVELGFGTYAEVVFQISAPIISFGFFLPKIVPALESVPWGIVILFGNGCAVASVMNPTYLILEKVAIKQGVTDQQQIKTMAASCYNMITSSGGTFGSFVVGGYLNDQVGFYWMYLAFTGFLTVTSTWHVIFLFKSKLVRRVYYDPKIGAETKDKSVVLTYKATDSQVEIVTDDARRKPKVSELLVMSMSRSQCLLK